MNLTLTADCVLPGCRQPVATAGDACDGCQNAFGDMLQPTGHRLTPEAILERDQATTAAYTDRARNTCWICEQPRTCTWEGIGWECTTCRNQEAA